MFALLNVSPQQAFPINRMEIDSQAWLYLGGSKTYAYNMLILCSSAHLSSIGQTNVVKVQ